MIEFSMERDWMDPLSLGISIWLTGLSGAGKTTIGQGVHDMFEKRGFRVELLDGDLLRNTISKDLDFTTNGRREQSKRITNRCLELNRKGISVIVAAILPFADLRMGARAVIPHFIEVYVNASIQTCEWRDVKGLYKKAREGKITNFTGIDSPYEIPDHPEIECHTDNEPIDTSVNRVAEYVFAYMRDYCNMQRRPVSGLNLAGTGQSTRIVQS